MRSSRVEGSTRFPFSSKSIIIAIKGKRIKNSIELVLVKKGIDLERVEEQMKHI